MNLVKKIVVLMIMCIVISCEKADDKIIIFHAGSLTIPFKSLETEFEILHPEFDIQREASGSRNAVRKITDLGRRCDVVASADYSVIDKLLIEDGLADYNIKFASNEMVITYTPESKHADVINSDNWYKLILTDKAQYGRSDHNADPCGYRTLMTWQLAEKYYNEDGLYEKLFAGCPLKNIRSAEVDLLALLESNIIDYLFIYKSVAIQHGLKYVTFPDEINLKQESLASLYETAEVKVSGKKPGEYITKTGNSMIYSFTIPKTVENKKGAVLFADFILSDKGQEILSQSGQPLLKPAVFSGNVGELPELLKKYN